MENRHFAPFAGKKPRKRGNSVRLHRPARLNVRAGKPGIITIATDRVVWTVDISKIPPDQKFEKVKWEILNAGFVFTEKIEKEVRRALELRP